MTIYGDPKNSDKFYIKNKDSIEWVPNLRLAKKYVSDPKYKNWYGKDIYCTSEELITDKQGKIYTKSQYEEKKFKEENNISINVLKQVFIDQTTQYIENCLLNFAIKYKYDNFYTMISWINSSIFKYKEEARLAIVYRDNIYKYHFKFLETLDKKLDNIKDSDLSSLYIEYKENFPVE